MRLGVLALAAVLMVAGCRGESGEASASGEVASSVDPCTLVTKEEVLGHLNLPPAATVADVHSVFPYLPSFPPVHPEPVGVQYCRFTWVAPEGGRVFEFQGRDVELPERAIPVFIGLVSGLADDVYSKWRREAEKLVTEPIADHRWSNRPVKGLGDQAHWVHWDKGSNSVGALVVRSGDHVLLVSVHTPEGERASRLARSRSLAALALERL